MAAEPGRRAPRPVTVAESPASMSATVRQPALRHRVDEPVSQEAEHGLDTGLPLHREAPRGRTRHQHRRRPERERDQDIDAVAHAPIHQHRDAAVDGRRPRPAAHPASRAPRSSWRPPWFDTTIAVGAVLDRRLRIVGPQDALHEHRHAGHLVADPREVVPGDVRVELLGRARGTDRQLEPVARVAMPQTERGDVHRPDDGAIPGGVRAAEQRGRRLAVAPEIELPPQRCRPRPRCPRPARAPSRRRTSAMPSRGRRARPWPVRRRGAPAAGTPTARPRPGTPTASPRISVRGSGDPDPRSTRGQTRLRAKAASLSASVRSAPAPPAT